MRSCIRCGWIDSEAPCVILQGGPCPPCRERAAIHDQIKPLEEQIAKLKAKEHMLGSAINTFHDPFTSKFPPEIASHILRFSLPTLTDDQCERNFVRGPATQSPVQTEWAAPLKLGWVCRRWRQLAWATPDLWTTLYVGITPSISLSTAESLTGLLSEWLGRSRALPLTIHFFQNEGSDSHQMIIPTPTTPGWPRAWKSRYAQL
ncbi:hypothetical protein M413DRAFT_198590 [Hebeloma cylindrosporum]|uniref:Uncharacterized protein n=1 Tax=Hebeloma cylindrosporum TaxID=76867 RepID=A0A0C2YEC4_HEBCY|nr:hypothetical protein M413DRAFT_198590 [Hebeloma cylindrosporum h7]